MKKLLATLIAGLVFALPLAGLAGLAGPDASQQALIQKAKPGAGMKPEQMREWIDEHLKLMNEMMSQMMGEHHMMMQNMGGPGMGMQGMEKK